MKRWDCIARRVSSDATEIVGVEIGVYKGDNARHLLELLPNLKLYMVDRWQPYSDEERSERKKTSEMVQGDAAYWADIFNQATAVQKQFVERAFIYRMSSEVAAKNINEPLDFVFIDGDHLYKSVKKDIRLWLPKIKNGGWLCGHDIKREQVQKAVFEMLPKEKIQKDKNNTWFYQVVR